MLQFNITVSDSKYIRLEDMDLVLPIRFRKEHNNERITLLQFILVSNFFGHFLERITVSQNGDLETFVNLLPSGTIASYTRKILKNMYVKRAAKILRERPFI